MMKNIYKKCILIICCAFLISQITLAGNENKEGTTDTDRIDNAPDSGQDTVRIQNNESFEYVAFGKKEKQGVTGSVYSISGDELLTSRTNNLMIALQGRLPGLSIIQNDGEPGKESFSTQIRGFDSPNSNGVMYVIDGVERSPQGIDINEIESVTILKDGAATAIYGMRGSGGVLLITTKTGMVGKTKIAVSVDYSMQAPTRLPSFVSAYDHANMYNQRLANDTIYGDTQDIANGGTGLDNSGASFFTPYELERYKNADMTEFYPVRDMNDDFMKNYSDLKRINVNFRGGSSKMRYFSSLGFNSQSSLFETQPFDKYSYDAESKSNKFNFRTNLDITLNPKLDLWINIGGSIDKSNAPYIAGSGSNQQGWNDLIEKLYQTPNNAYNDLTPEGEVLVKRDKLSYKNTKSLYGDLNRTGSLNGTTTRLSNTFGARQQLDELLQGLSACAQLAFDIHSVNTQVRKRSYEAYEVVTLLDQNGVDSLGYNVVPGTSNSTLSDAQETFFSYMYNMRFSLNYDQTFAEKHGVSAMLMAERQMQQKQVLLPTNYMGLAGRIMYDYNSKYYVDANFAYQGSEQFAKGKRFGFFPSVSAGWVLSNENFLKDKNAISFLKLRASAGQTGNTAYAYGADNQYLFLTSWNSNSTEAQLGNENIQWETSTKFNIGIESEFYNSLYLGADVYYHKNTDIIVKDISIIPDGMMGLGDASPPPANLGEATNKGFELVAGYNKQISRDFNMSVNGNVSFNQNEQTYTAELPYDETYAYPYRRQGYPVDNNWGYKTDGLFNSVQEIESWADQTALGGVPIPGDIKYLDLTNDGVVDEKDKAPLGIGQAPELVYGVKIGANYKWFDFSAFVNGAGRRNVYLQGVGVWSNNDNFTEQMKDSWTAEKYAAGEVINYPRLAEESTNNIKSDYWIADGSFVRLRNVELGFTMPDRISNLIKAESIRIYANGLNLFAWDKLDNDNFDAESVNASTTNYPILKAYNFGISVKF